MKKRYLFLLLIFFGSCTSNQEERRNITCLIDYSGTISNNTLNKYASVISDNILSNLYKNDKISVLPIDEGAKTNPQFIAYLDLESENFEKKSDGFAHKEELEKKRVDDYLTSKSDSIRTLLVNQKKVRKEYTKYTDILSALEQVASQLEYSREPSTLSKIWNNVIGKQNYETSNILVVFSDMIHESSNYNFKSMTKNELENLFQDLEKKDQIPNLKNVDVFVSGRTASNNETVENIKFFWEEYFNLANANLRSYSYDSYYSINKFLK